MASTTDPVSWPGSAPIAWGETSSDLWTLDCCPTHEVQRGHQEPVPRQMLEHPGRQAGAGRVKMAKARICGVPRRWRAPSRPQQGEGESLATCDGFGHEPGNPGACELGRVGGWTGSWWLP